jgi:hypothetical protein
MKKLVMAFALGAAVTSSAFAAHLSAPAFNPNRAVGHRGGSPIELSPKNPKRSGVVIDDVAPQNPPHWQVVVADVAPQNPPHAGTP